jgi:FkbM family methyltransferase
VWGNEILNNTTSTVSETDMIFSSHGLRFPPEPRFITPKKAQSLRSGKYECREADAARAIGKHDDTVLELGGGIGFMSTFLSKICKVREIHTFEANPALIPYIKRVHSQNNVTNVELYNALLGHKSGKARFYERQNFLASSLEENPSGLNSPVIEVHEVDVIEANSLISKINPSVLVCDVEGAEVEIFSKLDLSSFRAVVIELHPQWIGEQGVKVVFDACSAANLTYYPAASNRKVVAFLRNW